MSGGVILHHVSVYVAACLCKARLQCYYDAFIIFIQKYIMHFLNTDNIPTQKLYATFMQHCLLKQGKCCPNMFQSYLLPPYFDSSNISADFEIP